MGIWSPALFSDDVALDVRGEYLALLSVGKESDEAERLLINYYSEILDRDDEDEPVFWFALAYTEWKKGRLSDRAKSKALEFIDNGNGLERWNIKGLEKDYKKRMKILEDLKQKLLSPMPPKKKARKATVHHCPWPVGSLLAYRIVTNKELKNHPLFMKYALLRVIKINKWPVSKLVPMEAYNERMLVGLYGWAGDEIPDAQIAEKLEFIPVKDYIPSFVSETDETILEGFPEESEEIVRNYMRLVSHRVVETCASLDWQGSKEKRGDITFLGCDTAYENRIPDFFDTEVISYTMTHFYPFDYTLCERLLPYYQNK